MKKQHPATKQARDFNFDQTMKALLSVKPKPIIKKKKIRKTV